MLTSPLFAAAVAQKPPKIKRSQGENVILPWLNENIHIGKQHVKKASSKQPEIRRLFVAGTALATEVKSLDGGAAR
jgi:hypothetical protein